MATHRIAVGELPSHNHTASVSTTSLTGSATNIGIAINNVSTSGIFSHSTGTGYGNGNSGQNKATLHVNATHTHTITINSTGEDKSHNNLQPYISIYIWKRTA